MTDANNGFPPQMLVAALVHLLNVKPQGGDRFLGMRRPGAKGRVYGGQVIGQALMAATQTVAADRLAHSLHAYFIRPGDDAFEIEYAVSRDLDGRSFSNRRVLALQQGEPIFSMTASFHRHEHGFDHAEAMPQVPDPDNLPDQVALAQADPDRVPPRLRRFLEQPSPFDWRPIGDPVYALETDTRAASGATWLRTRAPVGHDQAMHRAILAMASDAPILNTACLPHRTRENAAGFQLASIDHALWFHGDFSMDDWLLYTTQSPWAGSARGFARGQIFRRDGTLIASVTQEGLMRFSEAKE